MELFSKAASWAMERGVTHAVDKSGDISFECPKCKKGKVIVHGTKGWFFCIGGPCNAQGESFNELENLLEPKASENREVKNGL